MSRGKLITCAYLGIALLSIVTFMYIGTLFELKTTNKFVVSYYPNNTGISVYEPILSNTMKCNLTTVNTIIGNMISKDFFYIVNDFSEGNLLDIMLTNGEDEYRIMYNRRTRDFMTMSNPFLKNYVPMTYIYE